MQITKLWYLGSFIISSFIFIQCCTSSGATSVAATPSLAKQKGMHVFGLLDSMNVQPLIETNFEWIAMVPYGDQAASDSPEVRHKRGDSLATTRRNAQWVSQMEIAHAHGLKVFMKPHVWLYNAGGKWRADIFPANDEDWVTWQASYLDFILRYAKVAERGQAELFCIGTEFTRLSIEKPDFWQSLIREVREVYSGKLTYAANWYEEYENITFWEELDYIGIQAYFPLVDHENPSVSEISKGWNQYLSSFETIHKSTIALYYSQS